MNNPINAAKNFIYNKLFKINDSTQRIAIGFGLGVFTGMLPGTGPLAALFLAYIFRVNRASALLASLLTNTWISLVTFIFAIKVGSAILGLEWHKVYSDFSLHFSGRNWLELFQFSYSKLLFPVTVGYLVVSLVLGLLSYLTVILILKIFKR
jgi:uncharacterized protein (DUF2062 family)